MRRVLIAFLIFLIGTAPIYAKELFKVKATLQNHLSADYNLGDKNKFIIDEDIIVPNVVTIPAKSTLEVEIIRIQKELRWHKSGYAICKILNYLEENAKKPVDISDKEIYLIARKHEYVDAREATIITTEILGWSAVSFFAPGVDIGYFFLKGAIIRNEHPNWFKSGVSNAYNNSILWFVLKGKEIDLDEGDEIQLKYLTKENLEKRIEKIDKRKLKTDKKLAKKELKKTKKEEKKAQKLARKEAKMSPKKLEIYLIEKARKDERQNFKKEIAEKRYEIWKEKWDEIEDIRTEELKEAISLRKEKCAFKNKIKNEKITLRKNASNLKGEEKRIALKNGKENIKKEKVDFKNKLKKEKQNKKLAKKLRKNEAKIVKREAKIWYKDHKKAIKQEKAELKAPIVLYSYNEEDNLKNKILNYTFYKKYQAPLELI